MGVRAFTVVSLKMYTYYICCELFEDDNWIMIVCTGAHRCQAVVDYNKHDHSDNRASW